MDFPEDGIVVGEEEDVRERFRAVEKGSRAAGKVLRTGKEPSGSGKALWACKAAELRVKCFARVKSLRLG